jgi:hypothetical protein
MCLFFCEVAGIENGKQKETFVENGGFFVVLDARVQFHQTNGRFLHSSLNYIAGVLKAGS